MLGLVRCLDRFLKTPVSQDLCLSAHGPWPWGPEARIVWVGGFVRCQDSWAGPHGPWALLLAPGPSCHRPEPCLPVPRGCLIASKPVQRLPVTAPRTERHGPWPHCSRAARHASPTALRSATWCCFSNPLPTSNSIPPSPTSTGWELKPSF